jgi:NAD(P)-dependent dehydrogenase (short-subunit alcohol dehydrogenase family)
MTTEKATENVGRLQALTGYHAMTKTILITGSTDGLGLATAKLLATKNHNVLLHGRRESKMLEAERAVRAEGGPGSIESYVADLSSVEGVVGLAEAVAAKHESLDVLINNAGVFRLSQSVAPNGLDLRFMVNTIAPYLLTRRLKPLLGSQSRVINLSSAAQAPVDHNAFAGKVSLDDSSAYAQSKLGLTMWSNYLAHEYGPGGPVVVAVNPASFLGTKMVKEAYGTSGNDIGIGAYILTRAALSDEFADASGRYFDNDSGNFANPHPDALDQQKNAALVSLIETTIAN